MAVFSCFHTLLNFNMKQPCLWQKKIKTTILTTTIGISIIFNKNDICTFGVLYTL